MPDNCNPRDCPMESRISALEQANARHSDTHQEIFRRVGVLETQTAVQENKLDTIDDKLDDIQAGQKSILATVEDLKSKPGKRWETLVAGFISSLGTAFLMWIMMGMPGVGK